jgi:hypothetical protein
MGYAKMTLEQNKNGTRGPEGRFPEPLRPLLDDLARIERILDRLEITEDLTERADLASELVRAASRHEDVVERAVLPGLVGSTDETALRRLATKRAELRKAMDYIHHRTQHLAPRNAHAGDAQGLEDAIFEVTEMLRAILSDEDTNVIARVQLLGPLAQENLKRPWPRHPGARPSDQRRLGPLWADRPAIWPQNSITSLRTPPRLAIPERERSTAINDGRSQHHDRGSVKPYRSPPSKCCRHSDERGHVGGCRSIGMVSRDPSRPVARGLP